MDRSQWTRIPFGDVVRNVNESVKDPSSEGIDRVIAMEHLDPRELQISRWGDIADGTTFTRRVRPGQTLFGKRRAYQRKVAFAEFDAICSGDILVFEAVDSRLLPELLPFLVQSEGFYANAVGTSAGSLSPRTNWRDLASYEVGLPPLDQQQRIANVLWAIERHRLALRTLKTKVASARSAVVSQTLQSQHDHLPLGDVLRSLRDGPFGSKIKTEHYSQSPAVRVLRLKDVQAGYLSDDDVAWLDSDHVVQQLETYRTSAKDVVIAGLGDENNPVARATIVGPAEGAVHKADIFRAQVKESSIRAEFLVEFLNSDYARPLIKAHSQGTTRLRINTTNLRKVEIPLPSQADQNHLLDVLAEMDASLKVINKEHLHLVEVARQLVKAGLRG